MSDDELRQRLHMLLGEHRDLDAIIAAAMAAPAGRDELLIARCKKRKLRLKDQIAMIERQLIPDIIA